MAIFNAVMISGSNERLDLTWVELTNEVYNEKLSVQFDQYGRLLAELGLSFWCDIFRQAGVISYSDKLNYTINNE